jgi:ligand-binding SRPBCC domain-containing protein
MVSTNGSNEKAVAGRTTWEATHFFVRQLLTTKIILMERPFRFYDEMQQGAFKSMEHDHRFYRKNGSTLMTDTFIYETPYGILGTLFNKLVLRRYMAHLLNERNVAIKVAAESQQWKKFLGQ